MRLPRTSVPELISADEESSEPSIDKTLRLVEATPSFDDVDGNHGNGNGNGNGASEASIRTLLEAVLVELRTQRNRNTRVVVKSGGKVLFLRAEQIDWVEA